MEFRRHLHAVVISDSHLGSYTSRADALKHYLQSIFPETLILNGDIVDFWYLRKGYWPSSHMQVIQEIARLAGMGTKVYYITGNHDESLRKYAGYQLGNFQLLNQLVLELHGRRIWFVHGDILDFTMQKAKWLAKMGGVGYEILIRFNRLVNKIISVFGKGRVSFSKAIKNSVKRAVRLISKFEETLADMALDNECDEVICGHIHNPEIRDVTTKKGTVKYLNSGDWVENLTALEMEKDQWKLVCYDTMELPEKEVSREENVKEHKRAWIQHYMDHATAFRDFLRR